EPSKKRLGTLRRNLQVQNLFCCATMSFAGEALPLPDAGSCRRPGGADTDADASGRPCPGWESLLLDPPCSGWGTVEKHPAVTRLWQGDKVKPLISLQRRLLERAARLLRPGGRLTYSTCTTNVEENEAQVLYALEELGFALEALPPPPGFRLAEPELGGCDGVWRVPGGADGQGFFVARLRKTGAPARANATGPGRAEPEHEGASSSTGDRGFFARPWKKESRFVGERRRHGKTVGKAMGKGEGGRSGNPLDSGRRIPRESLAGPWLDPAKLPPGEIVVFNDVAHLLPEQSASLLPPSLAWKGFPLGRVGSGGEMRAFPSLRSLMPAADGHSLVVDDPAPVLALLAGQSLRVEGADNEAGLYYRDLPLCRLTVKGRRAMLPPL
ncbi:MAG: hypothetical protein LBH65_03725, partial [Desulfovibrio sp.]|nr:hypothetical protein [Desulfovibrio sp.]